MFERFERPVKILCLGLAALLAWQVGNLILTGNPLARLKIPELPTLPGATNEAAKGDHKATHAPVAAKTGTNGTAGTNMVSGTNPAVATNVVQGTNAIKGTNSVAGANELAKSTNAPSTNAPSTSAPAAGGMAKTDAGAGPKRGGKGSRPAGAMPGLPPGVTPEMLAGLPPEVMAQMMGGGAFAGPMGGGMKKVELPPEVQARMDKIIQSEIFGPIMRMPMMLLGITDKEAFIQATNGQSGPVKVGGEMGGIKLLRIGINRVLIEQDGQKQELTIFDGAGGESLMPKPTDEPSTNAVSTNAPSTNAPPNKTSNRKVASLNASTNQTLASKQKEIP